MSKSVVEVHVRDVAAVSEFSHVAVCTTTSQEKANGHVFG